MIGHMLITCVVYKDGKKIAEPPIEEISDYLNQPSTFVWVALKDPDPAELEQMKEEFDLHPLAVEDAQRGHQRPKVEEYGDSLFVVLHIVELSEQKKISTGELDVFIGKNYVLSVRTNAQQGFTDVRARCEREPKLLKNGSAFVLYALMDAVVDRYFPIVTHFEHLLEGIEEKIFSETSSARRNIERLYRLKRKLILLQHAATPLTEAVGKLYGGRVPQICAPMQDYFRDVSDHAIRISRSIESIRDMTSTAIQVNLSLISLNESEVTKKLASYGALFAVPTAIAGIYGMNFKFIPELEWQYGYPVILGLILVADLFLWWRFRKANWI